MGFRISVVFVVVLSILAGAAGKATAQDSYANDYPSIPFRIDVSSSVRFVALMDYIRSENTAFFAGWSPPLTPRETGERVKANREDSELTELIDSLLATAAYVELSRIMRSFGPEKLEGQAAYRETFYRLPWTRTQLMGDVDSQYLQFLHRCNPQLDAWINDLAGKLRNEDFITHVMEKATRWLPPELTKGFLDTVQVYVYFDGNRGSFRSGRCIYIDLMRTVLDGSAPDSACDEVIACIAAHELHHIIYGGWLADQKKRVKTGQDWLDGALRQWRDAVLMEGSARFCDWENLPECARDMVVDDKLGEEIFATWESVFLRLSSGDIDESEYLTIRNSFEHERALRWFKQYLTEHYPLEEARKLLQRYPSFRPVPHYYVGYRIFSEILQAGGKSQVFYAMLHPDELLDIYHEMINDNNSAPQLSREMVARWSGL